MWCALSSTSYYPVEHKSLTKMNVFFLILPLNDDIQPCLQKVMGLIHVGDSYCFLCQPTWYDKFYIFLVTLN